MGDVIQVRQARLLAELALEVVVGGVQLLRVGAGDVVGQ